MANPSGPPTALDSLTVAGVPTMGMAGVPATAGNVYFVSSLVGSNGNTGAANSPFATLAFAYSKCIANNGDTVIALAGHAETISAAGGLTLNIAGVTILGLGEGATRPTLTFSTATTATVLVTAASNQILNFVFVCNIDALGTFLAVQAASFTGQIEFHDGGSAKQPIRCVLGTAAADRLTLNGVYQGVITGGTAPVNFIRLVGTDIGNIVLNYYGVASTAVVEFITTACTNIFISGYFYNSGTTNLSKNVVDTAGGSTWFVSGYDGVAGISFDGGSGKAITGNDATAVLAIADNSAVSAAAAMVNGNTIFTVAGGPIEILSLVSICQTANDGTASTLQYSSSGTLGTTTQTISGASAVLTSAAAGTSVVLQGTALSTAPLVNANAANITAVNGSIVVPAGTIKMVIGTGSTTGTWRHYIRYRPLASGVTVS